MNDAAPASRPSVGAILIASWGVLGVLLLLGQALYRLTPLAIEPLADGSLTTFQAVLYAGWVVFNAWAEGYRAFQLRFSPRVVARAFHLGNHPRALFVAFAAPFCMSFFHATRRGKIVAWGILAMIVTLVVLVRQLPQPWRGIIDGGVVVGLAWGVLAILYYFARAIAGHRSPVPPDIPEDS